MSNEQTHPLHATDKKIIDSLIIKKEPEDIDYINLARLINRYSNFPGENEIKNDIEKILKFWKITKNELFLKTKNIWSKSFRPSNTSKDLEVKSSRFFPSNNIFRISELDRLEDIYLSKKIKRIKFNLKYQNLIQLNLYLYLKA